MRPGAWERVARWFAGGSAGVHSADAPAQLAGMLHDVVESHASAKVICCCSSALHRSKQGMQLAARAQRGVVLSRRRIGRCVCARPPPTLALARQAVWLCVWRVDAFSIVRQSKEVPRITMLKVLTRTREKYSLFSLSPRAEIHSGAIRIILTPTVRR